MHLRFSHTAARDVSDRQGAGWRCRGAGLGWGGAGTDRRKEYSALWVKIAKLSRKNVKTLTCLICEEFRLGIGERIESGGKCNIIMHYGYLARPIMQLRVLCANEMHTQINKN